METLERHHIAIDQWSPLYPDETTFLLTHLHTDHARIPRTFAWDVYASTVAGQLTDRPQVRPILVPGQWYRTHRHHHPFQVLKTEHTPESIGFYFPTLAVLYVGDGTVPAFPRYRSLTVVYDPLHAALGGDLPTPAASCRTIARLLATACPVLQAVHHGILGFLSASCGLAFRLDPSVSRLSRRTAEYLGMEDRGSPYLLVGRSYDATERIVPSSYDLLTRPDADARAVLRDGKRLRVFCSLHATRRDIQEWHERYPYNCFEPMVHRGI